MKKTTLFLLLLIGYSVNGQERLSDVKSGDTPSLYSVDSYNEQTIIAEVNPLGIISIYSLNDNDEKELISTKESHIRLYNYVDLFFQYPYLSFSVGNKVIIYDLSSEVLKTIIVKNFDVVNFVDDSADAKSVIVSVYNKDLSSHSQKLLTFDGSLIDLPEVDGDYINKHDNTFLYVSEKIGLYSYFLIDIESNEDYLLNVSRNIKNIPVWIDSTYYFASKFGIYHYTNGVEVKLKDLPIDELYDSEMYIVDSLIYFVLISEKDGSKVTIIDPSSDQIVEEFHVNASSYHLSPKSIRRLGNGVCYINDYEVNIIPDLANPDSILIKNKPLDYKENITYKGKYYVFMNWDTIYFYDKVGALVTQSFIKNRVSYSNEAIYLKTNKALYISSIFNQNMKLWKFNNDDRSIKTIDISDDLDDGLNVPRNWNIITDQIINVDIKNAYKLTDMQFEKINSTPLLSNIAYTFHNNSIYYLENEGVFNLLKRYNGKGNNSILKLHSLIPVSKLTVLENYYLFTTINDIAYVEKDIDDISIVTELNSQMSIPFEFNKELFLFGWQGVRSLTHNKILLETKFYNLFILDNELYGFGDYIYKFNSTRITFDKWLDEKQEFRYAHNISDDLILLVKQDEFNKYSFSTFDGKSITNLNLGLNIDSYKTSGSFVITESNNKNKIYDLEHNKLIYEFEMRPIQEVRGFIHHIDEYTLVLDDYTKSEVTVSIFNSDQTFTYDTTFINSDPSNEPLVLLDDKIYLTITDGMFTFDKTLNKWRNVIDVNIVKNSDIRIFKNHVYFVGNEHINGIQFYRYKFKEDIAPYSSSTNLSIFPNPTTETINFQYYTEAQSFARIYNSNGQMVKHSSIQPMTEDQKVSIGELPIGLYFLEVNNQESSVKKTGKFVKIN